MTSDIFSKGAIPEVPRPPVSHKSVVLLVDAPELRHAFVRPAQRDSQQLFDDILMDVAMYGATASPLKEPPVLGQTVVAKFSDGNYYRAVCRRVISKLNKYLLEYIEYGNGEVQGLEDLRPCPAPLTVSARPTVTSQVVLLDGFFYTPAARRYLKPFIDHAVELTLTTPWGELQPSGSPVRLAVARGPTRGEEVNRELQMLCLPY